MSGREAETSPADITLTRSNRLPASAAAEATPDNPPGRRDRLADAACNTSGSTTPPSVLACSTWPQVPSSASSTSRSRYALCEAIVASSSVANAAVAMPSNARRIEADRSPSDSAAAPAATEDEPKRTASERGAAAQSGVLVADSSEAV